MAFLKSLRVFGREGSSFHRQVVFRGTAFAALLERCGIEPHRYWILVDLFQTLSKRQEVIRMGSHNQSLRSVVILWFFLSQRHQPVDGSERCPLWRLPPRLCRSHYFSARRSFDLRGRRKSGESCRGLILAHQPVNGATWSGAKLTHLIKIVVYIVASVNGVPALVGIFLHHHNGVPPVVYFPVHIVIALGAGLVVALLCCSLFGWLVRFIPARRLKAAAAMAQVLPMCFC